MFHKYLISRFECAWYRFSSAYIFPFSLCSPSQSHTSKSLIFVFPSSGSLVRNFLPKSNSAVVDCGVARYINKYFCNFKTQMTYSAFLFHHLPQCSCTSMNYSVLFTILFEILADKLRSVVRRNRIRKTVCRKHLF